jgi:tRNA nucleotidyltransferase (CCA-adding enzyme)
MAEAIDALTKTILPKILPTPQEQQKILTLSQTLTKKIFEATQTEGITATIRVEGSIAKDTYLKENPDIDIFIRLPTTIPRKKLGDIGLRIAKKAAGNAETLERFAEHPYLEIFTEGYRVDIVPCYDAKPGEWQSATDRTPYHTDYIKSHLSKPMRDEVRLLKKFMQAIGVYGAEIKIGGFSGYLCELLILKYGSLAEVIKAFADYSQRIIVDIENYYAERKDELPLLFPEPLVIVDPVDKGRNVASAVQPQKLYTFIAATRAFQKKPDEQFFYPTKTHALSPDLLSERIAACGASLLFLVVGEVRAVPDVLWGQLYRTKRSLRTLLETNDYTVLRDAVWSNEESLNIFLFELEQHQLPNIKKHLGPPLHLQAESEKFIEKYGDDKTVFAGPYIENQRWVVELPRKTTNATSLLNERLQDGGKNAGVAELLATTVQKEFQLFLNGEILKVYVENSDFAVFLTEFLLGKPFWLKTP